LDLLIAGLFLFFFIHLVPSLAGLRRKLVTTLGNGLYVGVYSVVSLTGFILIIYGKFTAEFLSIWAPPIWASNITIFLMAISIILLAAIDRKTNLNRITRHPMLWGVTFWSVAHLSANGDLASILLFGSFGVFALIAMFSANLRGTKKSQTKHPIAFDVRVLVTGLVVYVIFILLHPYLIGVSVI